MISGYTVVWNGNKMDFCWKHTVLSLQQVCDEVVIGYIVGEDDTHLRIKELCAKDPRVRCVEFPDPKIPPKGDPWWVINWMNNMRQFLKHPMQLYLDADEVLTHVPAAHALIKDIARRRGCAWFRRLNFVKDGHHLIPTGHCIGDGVARLGPTKFFMPTDEPHPEGEPEIRKRGIHNDSLVIFHYGFIRKTPEFFKKIEVNNRLWFGQKDKRYDPDKPYDSWWDQCTWKHLIKHWGGEHPPFMHGWLKERKRL